MWADSRPAVLHGCYREKSISFDQYLGGVCASACLLQACQQARKKEQRVCSIPALLRGVDGTTLVTGYWLWPRLHMIPSFRYKSRTDLLLASASSLKPELEQVEDEPEEEQAEDPIDEEDIVPA